jgi:PAS domain S-box-containing protein
LRELKGQFVSALLVILTVAAAIAAAINLQQQSRWVLPEDGVTWADVDGKVKALHVREDSPGDRAGIRRGDLVTSIESRTIQTALDVTQVLIRLNSWRTAKYTILRDGREATASVIIGEAVPDRIRYFLYFVGACYLAIGLFVYVRRGSADKAVHFFWFCLASFVLFCFHYTGKLNAFDKAIYWGNVTAGVLAPALFAHFCVTYPERRAWLRGWHLSLIYLPGLALLAAYVGFAMGYLRTGGPLLEVIWLLDRWWLVHLALWFSAGVLALALALTRAEDPIVRAQLTWLRNGALFGMAPFAFLYVLPYAFGVVPTTWMKVSTLLLPLIPLTFAYAVLRYRLMDVDIIFQQGFVYTLATLAVVGCFFGIIFALSNPKDLSPQALAALLLIAAFVFQPIRAWLQEQLDRYLFYKDRYDYRRTLIEFARELGSQTNLRAMLQSVADRLAHTLSIRHVAFFLWNEADGDFRLEMASDRYGKPLHVLPLDLSFLSPDPSKPYLFFERTKFPLDVASSEWTQSVRHTIGELDLTYYLPCQARGKTIAYLGVSRTTEGDFLSSDDVELLVTLSGYVGIAIENARLYRSLERKVEEYERLKEFSENIVESINVGILAADLDDRVESWNTQIERLTGIRRDDAVGRRLSSLFPAELVGHINGFRGEAGVHNVYKFPLQTKEREVILNLAVAPLVSKEGHQIGRLVIFDDVTDRAVLEQRLVQADKLSSIGLLAAGVAHEVNTPLAVISTYAQMLAKQITSDDPKSKLLDKIAKQTFRASEIVNSLLNFSRTSTTDFLDLDLNRLVRETVTLIEHQLDKAQVKVQFELEDPLPLVKGNSGKLQQVFLNLFLNARDAMPMGGSLRILTYSEDQLVRVEVVDTGGGIAPEHLSRIYDPFFTTKAPKKGTGLGLSVTYGIIREHGGTIEVSSKLGEGTAFQISLPLARCATEPRRKTRVGEAVA